MGERTPPSTFPWLFLLVVFLLTLFEMQLPGLIDARLKRKGKRYGDDLRR